MKGDSSRGCQRRKGRRDLRSELISALADEGKKHKGNLLMCQAETAFGEAATARIIAKAKIGG